MSIYMKLDNRRGTNNPHQLIPQSRCYTHFTSLNFDLTSNSIVSYDQNQVSKAYLTMVTYTALLQILHNRHVFVSRDIPSGVYGKYSGDLASTGKVPYQCGKIQYISLAGDNNPHRIFLLLLQNYESCYHSLWCDHPIIPYN